MSKSKSNMFKLPEKVEGNPFTLPDGYFSGFASRLSERIGQENEEEFSPAVPLWKRVRPHLALAAAIIGFALISFTILQVVTGNKNGTDSYYNLSLLDESGIINDEAALQESYVQYFEEGELTEWEKDAISYLASNEVNLEYLLNEN